jgi:hypothetical protein
VIARRPRGVRRLRNDREGQGTAGDRTRDAARGQILYTYLHLAPDPEQTADLVRSGVTAIAYETVTGPQHACRCSSR